MKKRNFFFTSLNLLKKGSDPELYPEMAPAPDHPLIIRGTDPQIQIRIRTNISRIGSTDQKMWFSVSEFLSRMEGAAGTAAGQRVSPEQESCEDKFDPY
jgi:hypothetical protein